MRDGLRHVLEARWAPWLIVALTLLVTLPSIQLGFYNDDHALRAALQGTWPGHPPAWDLYRFASGDAAENRATIAAGGMPWWTAPELKLHLVRPLTSLLFGLDYRVFADNPLGYHLHSIAWYLALTAAAGVLFRNLLPRATAHLALLIFALSAAHFYPFAWISCRHLLVAAVPSVLGLTALLRARPAGAWWCGLGLGLGLTGSEAALGVVGFVLAYAALAKKPGTAARIYCATPTLLVALAYVIIYSLLGGGAAHSDGYVDPLHAPLRFAERAVTVLPIMLGNAVFGMPAELATVANPLPLVLLGLAAVSLAAWLARRVASSLSADERSHLPWLLSGAVSALLPALGGFPGARNLLLPNLGFAVALALLIREGTQLHGLARAAAGLLLFVHLVLSPLVLIGNASYNAGIGRAVEAAAKGAELGPHRPRAFVIGASDPMITMYVPAVLAATTPERLACWSVLSGSKQSHRLARTGPNELALYPTEGPLLRGAFESLFRSQADPFQIGETVQQCGASYRVSALQDGRPSEVRITFDRPLDDPSIRLLLWKDNRLRQLTPPVQGASAELPWSAGPLGVF
jgi:hypothetical protein